MPLRLAFPPGPHLAPYPPAGIEENKLMDEKILQIMPAEPGTTAMFAEATGHKDTEAFSDIPLVGWAMIDIDPDGDAEERIITGLVIDPRHSASIITIWSIAAEMLPSYNYRVMRFWRYHHPGERDLEMDDLRETQYNAFAEALARAGGSMAVSEVEKLFLPATPEPLLTMERLIDLGEVNYTDETKDRIELDAS